MISGWLVHFMLVDDSSLLIHAAAVDFCSCAVVVLRSHFENARPSGNEKNRT